MQDCVIKNKINFLKVANKSAVDTINNVVKVQTGVAVEPVKGDFLDGYSFYQLQGTDKQGHHIGGLIVINYSKNAIDQVIGMNKTILEKGSRCGKSCIKSILSLNM